MIIEKTFRERRSALKQTAWICSLMLVAVLAGCSSGPKTMRVWGDVAYDGKPVEEGDIVFFPVDGTSGPSTGGAIKDGRYDVPSSVGPLANGTYRVQIDGVRKAGRYIPSPSGLGPSVEVMENYFPASYNSKTTLKFTVSASASENHRDFRLEKLPE